MLDDVAGVEAEVVLDDVDVGVERLDRLARRGGLRLADPLGVVDHLALQVGGVDDVVVDEAERADPGRGQVERGRGAEPAGADQQHLGVRASSAGRRPRPRGGGCGASSGRAARRSSPRRRRPAAPAPARRGCRRPSRRRSRSRAPASARPPCRSGCRCGSRGSCGPTCRARRRRSRRRAGPAGPACRPRGGPPGTRAARGCRSGRRRRPRSPRGLEGLDLLDLLRVLRAWRHRPANTLIPIGFTSKSIARPRRW